VSCKCAIAASYWRASCAVGQLLQHGDHRGGRKLVRLIVTTPIIAALPWAFSGPTCREPWRTSTLPRHCRNTICSRFLLDHDRASHAWRAEQPDGILTQRNQGIRTRRRRCARPRRTTQKQNNTKNPKTLPPNQSPKKHPPRPTQHTSIVCFPPPGAPPVQYQLDDFMMRPG